MEQQKRHEDIKKPQRSMKEVTEPIRGQKCDEKGPFHGSEVKK